MFDWIYRIICSDKYVKFAYGMPDEEEEKFWERFRREYAESICKKYIKKGD